MAIKNRVRLRKARRSEIIKKRFRMRSAINLADFLDGDCLVEFRAKNGRRDLVPGLFRKVPLSPDDDSPAALLQGEIDDEGSSDIPGPDRTVLGSGEVSKDLITPSRIGVGLTSIDDLDPSIPNEIL
jgi:hypothetical protein